MNVLLKRVFPILTLGVVMTFIAYGLWLANQPISVPLQGQFEASTINVTSKITARIAAQHAREGDAVSQGTLLVTLDSPELRAKQTQAAAVRSAAQAKLSLVNAGARDEDIRAAEAAWRRACGAAGGPTQDFVSNNAVPCGSTIGPLSATRLGIRTVDVGIGLLSMHSARELCGVRDPGWLAQAMRAFYASS